jgi:hypothetical protein
MVEIRFGDQHEIADLAGLTVGEAREQFRGEFGIPAKAQAKLNGDKVKKDVELDTVINDDDNLSFAVAKTNRGAYLIGAVLLALAVTGGVFAAGFINATATLNGTVKSSNFADVSANATGIGALSWTAYGAYRGSIPAGSTNGSSIFNVDTASSGYTGDLVVTITLSNAQDLSKVYRLLGLQLMMCDQNGNVMDINEDGTSNATTDWVMLTLDNGAVSLYPHSTGNVSTVRVKGGFYITNVKPYSGWSGSASPQLYCEVAQR